MEPLLLLAVFACPVGMGLMMWFMMRGMTGGKKAEGGETTTLADLKAEQARLTEKIDALERKKAATAAETREPEEVEGAAAARTRQSEEAEVVE